MKNYFLSGALFLIALLLFPGCSDSDSKGDVDSPKKLEIKPSTVSLAIGESIELSFVTDIADQQIKIKEWSSDDVSIAEVSSEGVVKAIAVGEANISLKLNGRVAKCHVSVTDAKKVGKIAIYNIVSFPDKMSGAEGTYKKVNEVFATSILEPQDFVVLEDGNNTPLSNVKWSVDDPKSVSCTIATKNDLPYIDYISLNPLAPKNILVTAEFNDQKVSFTLKVEDNPSILTHLYQPCMDFGASREEIAKYEKANGGVLEKENLEDEDGDESLTLIYSVDNKKPLYQRVYHLINGKMEHSLCVLMSPSLIYDIRKLEDGTYGYYFKPQFLNLVAANGFPGLLPGMDGLGKMTALWPNWEHKGAKGILGLEVYLMTDDVDEQGLINSFVLQYRFSKS